MSPLDLAGPDFLALYLVVTAAAGVLVAIVRNVLAGPYTELGGHDLAPQEIGFLAGGPAGAVDATIASQVATGQLVVDEESQTIRRGARLPPTGPGATYRTAPFVESLEATVYDAVPEDGCDVAEVRTRAGAAAEVLSARLEELQLLLTQGRRRLRRVAPIAAAAALALLGIAKIGVGISRGRPVLFLMVLTVGAAGAFVFWASRARRLSGRGERLLSKLRRDGAALEAVASSDPKQLSAADAALAVSLFGGAVLGGTALATMLTPPVAVAASSGGSAFGGSSCSSCSSCGGGCGGCGGGCGGCGGCGG